METWLEKAFICQVNTNGVNGLMSFYDCWKKEELFANTLAFATWKSCGWYSSAPNDLQHMNATLKTILLLEKSQHRIWWHKIDIFFWHILEIIVPPETGFVISAGKNAWFCCSISWKLRFGGFAKIAGFFLKLLSLVVMLWYAVWGMTYHFMFHHNSPCNMKRYVIPQTAMQHFRLSMKKSAGFCR